MNEPKDFSTGGSSVELTAMLDWDLPTPEQTGEPNVCEACE